MGQKIIKQPNGLYCIFSSIVDNIVVYNANELELIEYFTEEIGTDRTKHVKKIIEKIENGTKVYYSQPKSFSEMIDFIKDIHGLDEAIKVQKMINDESCLQ